MQMTSGLFCGAAVVFVLLALGCAGDGSERPGPDSPSGHASEDDHAGEVTLTPGQLAQFEPQTATVTLADIDVELALTAEVSLNEEKVAHIHPRVPGIVVRIVRTLGDTVRKDDVLAIIESRDLADAEADYLVARETAALAEANFTREEGLWREKITSEREYLDSKRAFAEAGIKLRSAEQKLHALGLSDSDVGTIAQHPGESASRYPITAPLSGIIIKKHVTPGELVGADELYTIADLDVVWLLTNVHEKDLDRVRQGQAATVIAQAYPNRPFRGRLSWIAATIDEQTRTLTVRVEVDNKERLLRPGMFARVLLAAETKKGVLTIPPSAVLTEKGETFVFVEEAAGRYQRREISPGILASGALEVLDGLKEGERVVTSGSFILKSELGKAGFEAGHRR
jgi:cobalt-zinc-cadmium efflux system membrane fusion protein